MTKFIWFPHTNQRIKSSLLLFLALISLRVYSQSIGVTSPVASTSYCAGTNVSISFSISGTFSNTPFNNVFSAQISDVNGSFAGSPVTIGTRTATTAGPITATLPSTLLTSGLYRFRVISSNPAINGSDNGANLSIISISLNSPTLTQSSFCQNETFTVSFSQSSCAFVNTPAANVYSVELSNASGSFTNPIVIGTRTAVTAANIVCSIPPGTTPGTGYRMRITASSPSVIGPDNGSNLTIMAPASPATLFGNGKWNVHCYYARNDYSNNYQGFYTENNLSFTTTPRWANSASPSAANGASGSAYSGCTFGSNLYSVSYKRTNIPCGYYQIDIPNHRTEVYLYINSSLIFSHTTGGDAHTNVWTGIISPSDSIEWRMSSLSSNGILQVTFTKLNQITMSAPITVCANTSGTLSVTNTGTVPLSYAWTPTVSLSPTTGATVIATPAATTVYTVTASDTGGSGCALFTNTLMVTVNPVPTTSTSITNSILCSGLSSTSITAMGANTYTWAPPTGLNTTTGNVVIASPTVATVYTVTGSNNCSTLNATRTVTVKTVPATPSPTAYGNNVWNVYCYNGSAFNNYYGYYTENNLSFASTNRWGSAASPTAAVTTTAGSGYQGCILTTATHGTVSKRTNFTCGYYRVDLTHNADVTLLIDSNQVFQHIGGGDAHTGVWTGFLGPSSLVEIRQTRYSSSTSSYITASFVPVPIPVLSPPITICAGTTATLTAGYIAGTSYSWAPGGSLSSTTGTVTISSTTISTNYTCTVKDSLTQCSASSSSSVTVNPLPTTAVAPIASTINCQAQTYTLTATGAYSYSWTPSTGLSATTGNSVVASPTANTIYTVIGDNNCATKSATTSVVVVPLINPTVYPTGTWNVYCYSGTTFTAPNYYGYYTEDGSGASGYDFNTATRWASGAAPSGANNTNGQAYVGCVMTPTNFGISFKRTGFACNTYSITLQFNDDNAYILINGAQVATRATSSATNVMWVGVLSPSTTVELRLIQNTTTSGLRVLFTPAAPNASLSVWSGASSNNWFTSSNWCGSNVPGVSDDVIIYNTGTLFQPVISGGSAACNNLTISAAAAATSTSSAIPAASLTMSGAANLDVYGDWLNYGVFTPGTGTISMLGNSTQSVNCTTTQTFNVLVVNNTGGGIAMSTGTHKINSGMKLLSGIVDQNGALQFLNGATVSNASNASYIEGPVVKYGNQAFTFPVGLNGVYRPIAISAPVSITDNFTAQYFHNNASPPYTSTSKDASIDHISSCEYWLLNRTGGSAIVYVTLSWDTVSCGISNLSDLVVARWDAGQVKWKDHGNGAVTGSTVSGTIISSAPVTVFSPFTLASRTAANVLPIELTDFWATCVDNGVEVNWKVASETNNDHFIVERSHDGSSWQEVSRVESKGNTTGSRSYSTLAPAQGDELFYYRLTQVDKDQQRKTFKLVTSQCNSNGQEQFSFYPNPAKDALNLVFVAGQDHPDGILTVTDNLGKTCFGGHLELKKGSNHFTMPISLKPGIYFVSYTSATFKPKVQKLVVE